MTSIKIECGCGQRYAFDVEPHDGRMPHTVACPVCGADGTGVANEARSLEPQPQDPSQATYHSWPTPADFRIPSTSPARWAFNFIRGTAGWGYPHRLALPGAGGECVMIRAARAFDPEAHLGAPFRRDGDELRVQCSPGVLTVTVAG